MADHPGERDLHGCIRESGFTCGCRMVWDCEFIFFNYVGYGAYKELTGRNIYQDCTSEILKDNLGQRLRFPN